MSAVTVRPARTSDVRGILALLQPWVERRILLGKDVVTDNVFSLLPRLIFKPHCFKRFNTP